MKVKNGVWSGVRRERRRKVAFYDASIFDHLSFVRGSVRFAPAAVICKIGRTDSTFSLVPSSV